MLMFLIILMLINVYRIIFDFDHEVRQFKLHTNYSFIAPAADL